MQLQRRAFLHSTAGLGLAALSGLLFTLAFPPYDLWPLIFLGFVPAIVAQHRVVPPRFSGLAYGVGFGCFYAGYFGPMFAGQHTAMAWVPFIAAAIATLGSTGSRAFHARTHYRWFVLEGAVSWIGVEAIRAFLPMIGTGGSVAFALYSQPWLIQPVGIFGIFGLGLLIMLINYALALGALVVIDNVWTRQQEPVPRSLVRRWMAGILVTAVGWVGLSVMLLEQAHVSTTSIRVAALQPIFSPNQALHTRKLFTMTREAAANGAQLVVWPEGALNFNPHTTQTALKTLARETKLYLALGYAFNTPHGLTNEAMIVTPEGEFLTPYAKHHPVTWMGETSATNHGYPTHTTPLGTLGTIICYDLNFTDTARAMAANGAQIIAVPSSDWGAITAKQYTNLVMRAVENRVTLIKADANFDSAVIAPDGRIVARFVSTTPAQQMVLADVPIGTANALLIRLGDWIGWLCAIGVAVFIALSAWSNRRMTPRPAYVPQ